MVNRKMLGANSRKLYTITVLALVFAFSVSVFKNIQYGVLWNDEAQTAMYAERVNSFGYPKVSDGKNILNLSETTDLSIGVKKSTDAWVYVSSWGQYYFAAPFVKMAEFVNDIYIKTAIVRIPFALLGFLGILIFGFSFSSLIKDSPQRLVFFNLYLLFELLSVPLALHIREVHYFSLTIFALSLLSWVFLKYYLGKSMKNLLFQILTFCLMFCLLNVYFPAFFSVLIFILVLIFFKLLKQTRIYGLLSSENKILFWKNVYLVPLFIVILSYFSFFEFFKVTTAISSQFNFGWPKYLLNIETSVNFFLKTGCTLFNFLGWLWIILQKDKKIFSKIGIKVAMLLEIVFVISILVVSRVPYFFERFFIFLQPIDTLVFILLVINLLRNSTNIKIQLFIIGVVVAATITKLDPFYMHESELIHSYRGPVDYIVGYIKQNFKNPENLIIATNYEEPSLMYYLQSRVVIGFAGNNLVEDQTYEPDIIIIRKKWPSHQEVLRKMLDRGRYKEVVLDVTDYNVNNIPDQTGDIKHLFETPKTDDISQKVTLYIKK